MNEQKKRWQKELHTLHAVCTVISQLQSNAAKGKMLVNFLNEHPFLEKYFRAVYQEGETLKPITWGQSNSIGDGCKTEIWAISNHIANRTLETFCGLTAFVVAKAFNKAGLDALVYKKEPQASTKKNKSPIGIEIHDCGMGIANGTLTIHGRKVGTLQFEIDKPVEKALKHLQSLGVDVYIPKYIHFPKVK